MADKVARDVRSRIMGSVRSKGTKPEIVLRSNLHRLGYRYRLHGPHLPGCPDLVFSLPSKGSFCTRMLLAYSRWVCQISVSGIE